MGMPKNGNFGANTQPAKINSKILPEGAGVECFLFC